jgi:hypothetical protein
VNLWAKRLVLGPTGLTEHVVWSQFDRSRDLQSAAPNTRAELHSSGFVCLCVKKNHPYHEMFSGIFFNFHGRIAVDPILIEMEHTTGCCSKPTYIYFG